MASNMDRLLTASPTEQVVAATMAIYALPRLSHEVDALVTFPGQGENIRLTAAIEAWQEPDSQARFLLVAGQNLTEKTAEVFDLTRLQKAPFSLTKTDGVLIDLVPILNTKAQAEWVVKMIVKHTITSVALYISSYHLLRAYLTLLKTCSQQNIRIPIIPVPVAADLTTRSPETGSAMWDLVPGEAQRILSYQEKGDVASFTELQDYLAWLHQQTQKQMTAQLPIYQEA